jgi:hypothetical protein
MKRFIYVPLENAKEYEYAPAWVRHYACLIIALMGINCTVPTAVYIHASKGHKVVRSAIIRMQFRRR